MIYIYLCFAVSETTTGEEALCPSQFLCTSENCTDSENVCDGINQCGDNSDEDQICVREFTFPYKFVEIKLC